LPQTVKAVPEYRIRVNGVYVPEICIQRENKDPKGDIQLVVKDSILGWFVVDDNKDIHSGLPHFKLEYRDETSWRLLPDHLKQASVDKGWNVSTPEELIGILRNTGVLK
jgi:hypothetical protein